MDSLNNSADELESLERPAKRPRLSYTPGSPEEIPEEWDLQAARAQNDNRLKTIFEGIFSKYGQDFTEVGDEIDLETGDIVVDNGHLLGLREENDAENNTQPWVYEARLSEEPDPNPDEKDQEDLPGQSENLSATSNPVPGVAAAPDAVTETTGKPGCDATLAYDKLGDVTAGPVSNAWQALDPVYEEPGPKEPLWQAPELPRIFSTPTAETRHANVVSTPQLPKLTREPSPPGSGSLWAVRQPRRPRTEVKPKATPSKSRPRAKRKHHSSPVVRDWSFAQTPDGDESDDPLQEFEPSPSPLKAKSMNIRSIPLPSSPLELTKNTDPEPDGGQSATNPENDGPSGDSEQGDMQSDVASQASSLQCESFETPRNADPGLFPGSTPSKSQREMTPDEAKVIVRMRYVQAKRWNDIIDHLPGRSVAEIVQWNTLHWTSRHADPPQLSAPWSRAELITLDNLKDLLGLSWSDIRAELPDRSHAEIEFELLRLWAGHDVWGEELPSAAMQDDVTTIHEEPVHSHKPPESPMVIIERGLTSETPDVRTSASGQETPRRTGKANNDADAIAPINLALSPVKPSDIFGSPTPSTPSRPGFRTPKKYNFTFSF